MNLKTFMTPRKLTTLMRVAVTLIILSMMTVMLAVKQKPPMKPPGTVEMKIPQCSCSKYIYPSYKSQVPNEFGEEILTPRNTTCNNETFVRGFGQKVVSYSFFEPTSADEDFLKKKNRLFFKGIRENLDLIKKNYPGWVMRLYYKVSKDSQAFRDLCDIACNDPFIDICDTENNPRLGNASVLYPIMWRFVAVVDVQVDYFLSRDLDSRISQREVASVMQFLSSDKAIHIMRDHPAHVAYMMGGTWGAKVYMERKNFFSSFKKVFKDALAYVPAERGGGYDQAVLSKFIYPWAKKIALIHDSYHCKKFPYTVPFPVQRIGGIGNYVGSVIALNATLGFTEGSICPPKCRPKDHQDWIYC